MEGHNLTNALVDGSIIPSKPLLGVWQGEPDEYIPARERLEGNEEPGVSARSEHLSRAP